MKNNQYNISVGDSIKVHYQFTEADKTRTQIFAGIVIAIRGKGEGKTFTIRKVSHSGVAIERIWPFSSPAITNIDILKRSKVRRAKLYYLRNLVGKKAIALQ